MTGAEKMRQLQSRAPVILPSLLLCDFGNLEREVDRLQAAGIQGFHLDVMDGHFVPNLTYGLPITQAMRRLTDLPLDVHLMIERPERFVGPFLEAGADSLTIHVEAHPAPQEVLQEIRQGGASAGLAINPDTPFERLEPALGACDLVLVMSVPAGFGGQAFRPVALERLRALRDRVPAEVILEVDGGVNRDTIGACTAAGAELLVIGSAIFRQNDYATAVQLLRQQARHAG